MARSFCQGIKIVANEHCRALWGLQSLFGAIPNVFGQGQSVKKLLKLEALYSQELGKPKAQNPEIGHLIILDRDLDW